MALAWKATGMARMFLYLLIALTFVPSGSGI
jgi:hypothetical protein